jgi:hypothetical protein
MPNLVTLNLTMLSCTYMHTYIRTYVESDAWTSITTQGLDNKSLSFGNFSHRCKSDHKEFYASAQKYFQSLGSDLLSNFWNRRKLNQLANTFEKSRSFFKKRKNPI